MDEAPQDVALDAEIVSDDVEARLGGGGQVLGRGAGFHGVVPVVDVRRGDAAGQVEPGHGRNGAGFFDELLRVLLSGG